MTHVRCGLTAVVFAVSSVGAVSVYRAGFERGTGLDRQHALVGGAVFWLVYDLKVALILLGGPVATGRRQKGLSERCAVEYLPPQPSVERVNGGRMAQLSLSRSATVRLPGTISTHTPPSADRNQTRSPTGTEPAEQHIAFR